jgi:hypothetical protein
MQKALAFYCLRVLGEKVEAKLSNKTLSQSIFYKPLIKGKKLLI